MLGPFVAATLLIGVGIAIFTATNQAGALGPRAGRYVVAGTSDTLFLIDTATGDVFQRQAGSWSRENPVHGPNAAR